MIWIASAVDVLCLLATGACGMCLWNWFIPLAFATAPSLSFGLAMGLALVTSCFVGSGKSYKLQDVVEKDKAELFGDAMLTQVIQSILKPGTLLLFGWILHSIIN